MEPLQEKWLPVPGHEGFYEVSNHGNVKRILGAQGERIDRLIRVSLNNYGYHSVSLTAGNTRTNTCAHRLVMAAFVGPCPSGYEVNHKDGNKANNHLDNLEYVLPKANKDHFQLSGKLRTVQCAECSNRFDVDPLHYMKRFCATCRAKRDKERAARWNKKYSEQRSAQRQLARVAK